MSGVGTAFSIPSRGQRGGGRGSVLNWTELPSLQSALCITIHLRFAECNVQLMWVCVCVCVQGQKQRGAHAHTHIRVQIMHGSLQLHARCALHGRDNRKAFRHLWKGTLPPFPPRSPPLSPSLSPAPPAPSMCGIARKSKRCVYALRRGEINSGMMYYALGEFASIVPREKITALPARFLELWERIAARRSIWLISLL